MTDSDEDLFESALADRAIAGEPAAPIEPPAVAGGFADMRAQAPQPADDRIPLVELLNERERRQEEQRRREALESELHRMHQARTAPQPPDFANDPIGFLGHGVRAAIDPVQAEVGALREYYSRREAMRSFGQEAVEQAYGALESGMRGRDPDALIAYRRIMGSLDPFGELVGWHQRQSAVATVGNDPQAWFERQLDERLQDPAFQAATLDRIRGSARTRGAATVTRLPPSLGRVAAAASSLDNGDASDESLFRHAVGR